MSEKYDKRVIHTFFYSFVAYGVLWVKNILRTPKVSFHFILFVYLIYEKVKKYVYSSSWIRYFIFIFAHLEYGMRRDTNYFTQIRL